MGKSCVKNVLKEFTKFCLQNFRAFTRILWDSDTWQTILKLLIEYVI